jgi:hypothetical protein
MPSIVWERGFFHVRSSSADQVDQLSDVEIEQLVKAADIVTMARTAVDRS